MPLSQRPDTLGPSAGVVTALASVAAAGLFAVAALGVQGAQPLAAAGAAVFVISVAALAGLVLARRAASDRRDRLTVRPQPQPGVGPTLLDALPDPVLLISATGPADLAGRRYLTANAAARELLRLTADQGLLVRAVRDPAVLEAVDEALFGSGAGECTYEIGGLQPKSLRVCARRVNSPPEGSAATPLALLLFRDETEHRRVERTRVDFLANASHELRTPLASLMGFIETLRGHAREDPAARDRFLAIMQSQAERMSRLIDDLMALSRIELAEHIAPQGDVDLAGVVTDVVDAAGPLARERNIVVETELPVHGRAMVDGDRDQLVQVVQNLVQNALKYSPAGGVIRVGVEPGLDLEAAAAPTRTDRPRHALLTPDRPASRYAALRVADQGAGIAREHLPRLTERFYRVEGQKSGEREGTGLGLAIVKHIANRHRGGLVVESGEGQGATFTVYLPETGACPRLELAADMGAP